MLHGPVYFVFYTGNCKEKLYIGDLYNKAATENHQPSFIHVQVCAKISHLSVVIAFLEIKSIASENSIHPTKCSVTNIKS